jgi:N-acetylglucosamine malate deacetylase 1
MRSVLAIFAHPDDIEFVAAGTLLLLKDLGWEIHYCNLANGCCGSTTTDRSETANVRLRESQASASMLGATFYPPICDDLDIFYNRINLGKVASIVRQAKPSVILTHAPLDYMEDHMETCRLVVTAAFSKGIPNFLTDPVRETYNADVAIYHAQPHGNRTPLGEIIHPDLAIDIDSVMDRKLQLLECHQSQQGWLQSTQKMNSYLQTMIDLGQEVARLGQMNCEYAEGWRKHLHLGFGASSFDPLREALVNRSLQQ